MKMTPDDGAISGIQHPPKICVDYLSHDWKKEDDIWTSWKAMSKQKKALDNGIRLENASWRTWAKQKYNLKTVNPEKLNWLKDSDVTWLYGPLHTAYNETSPKSSYTDDVPLTKSCLKKKTMSEVLRPTIKGRYGSLVTSNSDTQLYKRDRDTDTDSSDWETASSYSSMSEPSTPTSGSTESTEPIWISSENGSQNNRKIQFNDRVEQCIAVDSDEDGENDGIVMKISSKKRKDCTTICKLAPTKLKEDRINNNTSLYSSNSTSSSKPRNTTTRPSSSYTTGADYDEDFDMDLDLDDYIPPPPPTHYYSGRIIQLQNEVNEFADDDDDSLVEMAVNRIVHWLWRR